MSGRTRKKSRHGEGRKPFYKEHRLHLVGDEGGAPTLDNAASQILAHKRYGGMWMDRGLTWQPSDLSALRILCEAESNIENCADALGRPPTNLAHRARDMGLLMPAGWAKLIRPAYIPKVRDPSIVLAYPFIVKKRPEHADILRAYSLVPRGYSPDVRADICQNVMLALYEGTVTLDDLERNKDKMRYFVAKFYKEQRPHQEVTGIESGSDDDDRPYYDRVHDLSADAVESEARDYRGAYRAWNEHSKPTPATQVEDIYEHELRATASISHTRGLHLEPSEVRLSIEADDWHDHIGTYAMLHKRAHVGERAINRFDMILTHDDRRKISNFCRDKRPAWKSYADNVHFVKYRGHRICAIINGSTGDVKTVMPREWKQRWVE